MQVFPLQKLSFVYFTCSLPPPFFAFPVFPFPKFFFFFFPFSPPPPPPPPPPQLALNSRHARHCLPSCALLPCLRRSIWCTYGLLSGDLTIALPNVTGIA